MSKRKILIVDDEKEFALLVKFNLEELGNYDVRVETSPTDVLNSAKDFQPDLIFLDIVMPEMEGPDVYSQLKRCTQFKETPVIFLTATVTEQEVQAHEGYIGGHQFFAKPGSLNGIVQCIEDKFRFPPYGIDFT